MEYPKCSVCGGDWHGLPGRGLSEHWGCPGEWATEQEKRDWLREYGFLTAP